MRQQHERFKMSLNEEQLQNYDAVVKAMNNDTGGVFFVYDDGGAGKTFLYNTISSRLRSERKIVITVASSGNKDMIE